MCTFERHVEFLQSLNLSHQLVPQRLLQSLSLHTALHQRLVGFRYPLDLLLQLLHRERVRDGG